MTAASTVAEGNGNFEMVARLSGMRGVIGRCACLYSGHTVSQSDTYPARVVASSTRKLSENTQGIDPCARVSVPLSSCLKTAQPV